MKFLDENSMWSNQDEKEKALAKYARVNSIFWTNFIGFLALYNKDPKNTMIRNYIKSCPLIMSKVEDDSPDLSVIFKVISDEERIKTVTLNKMTRLLAKIKKGEIDKVDENLLRDILKEVKISKVHPNSKIMNPIKSFMKGEILLTDLINPLYEVARKQKLGNEWVSLARKVQSVSSDDSDMDSTIEDEEATQKQSVVHSVLTGDKKPEVKPRDTEEVTQTMNQTLGDIVQNITYDDFMRSFGNKVSLCSYFLDKTKSEINSYLRKLGVNKSDFSSSVQYVLVKTTSELKNLIHKEKEKNEQTHPTENHIKGLNEDYTRFIFDNFMDVFKQVCSPQRRGFLTQNIDFKEDVLIKEFIQARFAETDFVGKSITSLGINEIKPVQKSFWEVFKQDPVGTIQKIIDINQDSVMKSAKMDKIALGKFIRTLLRDRLDQLNTQFPTLMEDIANGIDFPQSKWILNTIFTNEEVTSKAKEWYRKQDEDSNLYKLADVMLTQKEKIEQTGVKIQDLVEVLYDSWDFNRFLRSLGYDDPNGFYQFLIDYELYESFMNYPLSNINVSWIIFEDEEFIDVFGEKLKNANDDEIANFFVNNKRLFTFSETGELNEIIGGNDRFLKLIRNFSSLRESFDADFWYGKLEDENTFTHTEKVKTIQKLIDTLGFSYNLRRVGVRILNEVLDERILDYYGAKETLDFLLSALNDGRWNKVFPLQKEYQDKVFTENTLSIIFREKYVFDRWISTITPLYLKGDDDTVYFIDNIIKSYINKNNIVAEKPAYVFSLYQNGILSLKEWKNSIEPSISKDDLEHMISDELYLNNNKDELQKVFDLVEDKSIIKEFVFDWAENHIVLVKDIASTVNMLAENDFNIFMQTIQDPRFSKYFYKEKDRRRLNFKNLFNQFGFKEIVLSMLEKSPPEFDQVQDILDIFEEKDQKKAFNEIRKGYLIIPLLRNMKGPTAPFPPTVPITEERIQKLLKFNDFEFKGMPRKRPKENYAEYFKRIHNDPKAKPEIQDLMIEKVEETPEQLEEKTSEYSKYMNNKHGNVGVEFVESYNVSLDDSQYEEFKNLTNSNFLTPCFHGTGNIAANFILRYGFSVVSSSDESTTGRMLNQPRMYFRIPRKEYNSLTDFDSEREYTYVELVDNGWEPIYKESYKEDPTNYAYTMAFSVDGIYVTNVTEKATQYLGDSGWSRQLGMMGVLLEIEANIGEEGLHHSSAGLGNDRIRSPEWCVFHPKGQIKIKKAHKVKMVPKKRVQELRKRYPGVLEENKYFSKSFTQYLKEEEVIPDDNVITYVFCDNQVPDNKENIYTWKRFQQKFENKNIIVGSHQRGVAVSFNNKKGLNGTIMVPSVEEFIGDDPDGLHSQYETVFTDAVRE